MFTVGFYRFFLLDFLPRKVLRTNPHPQPKVGDALSAEAVVVAVKDAQPTSLLSLCSAEKPLLVVFGSWT